MSDDTASNPSKKRKTNDGRVAPAVGGGFLSSLFGHYFSRPPHDTTSTDQLIEQSMSNMERMEQSMLRMEEKLSTLSSVESRCEELESKLEQMCSSLENKLDSVEETLSDKCSSLEDQVNMLQSTVEDIDNKCDSLEDNLEDKVNTLQDTLCSSLEDKLEQKCSSLEDKLESVEETLSDKCSSLEDQVSTLHSTVEDLDNKCNSMEDNLEDKVNKLQDTLDSAVEFLQGNKFSSLEDILEDQVNTFQVKLDRALEHVNKNHNQNWEYPVPIDSFDWLGDQDEAAFLLTTATALKEKTTKLREGVFPDYKGDGDEVKAISMVADAYDSGFNCSKILPHWIEFAAALMQFNPAMDEVDGTCFDFGNFQLNKPTLKLIKEALIGKAFKKMRFYHNLQVGYDRGGLSMDAILDVVESNKHLRNLTIFFKYIRGIQIEKFCSIVHKSPLVELDIYNCCPEPGVGNAILATLLARRDCSKLEVLSMHHCHITSDVSTVLAESLAANPKLKRLDLRNNHLNDSDAALIANSLRSNTALEVIYLLNNNITPTGLSQSFRSVLFDDSSLNAVADSNHSCYLGVLECGFHFNLNLLVKRCANRGRKIYFLLSFRHRAMSNTQYLSDMDVKVLPNMLEYIQRYGEIVRRCHDGSDDDEYNYDVTVGSLSIVYEVMRKWEKVFCLYERTELE